MDAAAEPLTAFQPAALLGGGFLRQEGSSPEFSRSLGEGGGITDFQPLQKRFLAAVMFLDISGFTALSEKMGQIVDRSSAPERLTHHLNSYFSMTSKIIVSHGGDLVKFAGDAAIVLWPVAVSSASDPAAAVRAAAQCSLDLQIELHNARLDVGVTLSVKIGIAMGQVALCCIGGISGRWEVFVTGAGVASSFSAQQISTAGGQVWITRTAWEVLHANAGAEILPMRTLAATPHTSPAGFLPSLLTRRAPSIEGHGNTTSSAFRVFQLTSADGTPIGGSKEEDAVSMSLLPALPQNAAHVCISRDGLGLCLRPVAKLNQRTALQGPGSMPEASGGTSTRRINAKEGSGEAPGGGSGILGRFGSVVSIVSALHAQIHAHASGARPQSMAYPGTDTGKGKARAQLALDAPLSATVPSMPSSTKRRGSLTASDSARQVSVSAPVRLCNDSEMATLLPHTLPPTLATWVTTGATLGWTRLEHASSHVRPAAVLFANLGISEATMISAASCPEPLRLVHRVLRAAQVALGKYGGSLNKFLWDDKGSTLLAVFGGPPDVDMDAFDTVEGQDSHGLPATFWRSSLHPCTRALLAGLHLIESVQCVHGCTPAVGITHGPVYMGLVGGTGRREYSVLGDAVNTAARMMACAAHADSHPLSMPLATPLLVDATVAGIAGVSGCHFIALTPLHMKGKAQVVPAFTPHATQGPTPASMLKHQVLAIVRHHGASHDENADIVDLTAVLTMSGSLPQSRPRLAVSHGLWPADLPSHRKQGPAIHGPRGSTDSGRRPSIAPAPVVWRVPKPVGASSYLLALGMGFNGSQAGRTERVHKRVGGESQWEKVVHMLWAGRLDQPTLRWSHIIHRRNVVHHDTKMEAVTPDLVMRSAISPSGIDVAATATAGKAPGLSVVSTIVNSAYDESACGSNYVGIGSADTSGSSAVKGRTTTSGRMHGTAGSRRHSSVATTLQLSLAKTNLLPVRVAGQLPGHSPNSSSSISSTSNTTTSSNRRKDRSGSLFEVFGVSPSLAYSNTTKRTDMLPLTVQILQHAREVAASKDTSQLVRPHDGQQSPSVAGGAEDALVSFISDMLRPVIIMSSHSTFQHGHTIEARITLSPDLAHFLLSFAGAEPLASREAFLALAALGSLAYAIVDKCSGQGVDMMCVFTSDGGAGDSRIDKLGPRLASMLPQPLSDIVWTTAADQLSPVSQVVVRAAALLSLEAMIIAAEQGTGNSDSMLALMQLPGLPLHLLIPLLPCLGLLQGRKAGSPSIRPPIESTIAEALVEAEQAGLILCGYGQYAWDYGNSGSQGGGTARGGRIASTGRTGRIVRVRGWPQLLTLAARTLQEHRMSLRARARKLGLQRIHAGSPVYKPLLHTSSVQSMPKISALGETASASGLSNPGKDRIAHAGWVLVRKTRTVMWAVARQLGTPGLRLAQPTWKRRYAVLMDSGCAVTLDGGISTVNVPCLLLFKREPACAVELFMCQSREVLLLTDLSPSRLTDKGKSRQQCVGLSTLGRHFSIRTQCSIKRGSFRTTRRDVLLHPSAASDLPLSVADQKKRTVAWITAIESVIHANAGPSIQVPTAGSDGHVTVSTPLSAMQSVGGNPIPASTDAAHPLPWPLPLRNVNEVKGSNDTFMEVLVLGTVWSAGAHQGLLSKCEDGGPWDRMELRCSLRSGPHPCSTANSLVAPSLSRLNAPHMKWQVAPFLRADKSSAYLHLSIVQRFVGHRADSEIRGASQSVVNHTTLAAALEVLHLMDIHMAGTHCELVIGLCADRDASECPRPFVSGWRDRQSRIWQWMPRPLLPISTVPIPTPVPLPTAIVTLRLTRYSLAEGLPRPPFHGGMRSPVMGSTFHGLGDDDENAVKSFGPTFARQQHGAGSSLRKLVMGWSGASVLAAASASPVRPSLSQSIRNLAGSGVGFQLPSKKTVHSGAPTLMASFVGVLTEEDGRHDEE